jgi:hypothetical protein
MLNKADNFVTSGNAVVRFEAIKYFDRSEILLYLFSTASRSALGPPQPPIQWIQKVISTELKSLGREADHSPSSSAEVKIHGAIPPVPYKSLW